MVTVTNYMCVGVDDAGKIRHVSDIGGSAQGGHVLLDAVVAGYRWVRLADLLADRGGWRYSPYTVAADDQEVLWYEDQYSKGTRFRFGTRETPGEPIAGSDTVHPDRSLGPGPSWVVVDKAFVSVSTTPALHLFDLKFGVGRIDLNGYVYGGPVSDGRRLWVVCQASIGSSWLLCVDGNRLRRATFSVALSDS